MDENYLTHVKYHTARLIEVRDEMSELMEKIKKDGYTQTEYVLLNDLDVNLRVQTELLDQAVRLLDQPEKKTFLKKILKK